jgi:hypothetical protein
VTTPRRILVTLALTLGVTLTAGLPAQAAFADKVTLATTVGTVTVAPVTGLAITAPCTLTTTNYTTTTTRAADGTVVSGPTESARTSTTAGTRQPVNTTTDTPTSTANADGTTTTVTATEVKSTTVTATGTWQASGTRGVTGYTVGVFAGPSPFASYVGNTTQFTYGPAYVDQAYALPVSVITHTSYGWTSTATAWVAVCS